MKRLALLSLLILASCARFKIYILDEKYFAETTYDLSFEAGQEVDLTGLYELDTDSTARLYIYELGPKKLELRARVPLRQRFVNLSGRWVKIYGFYSGAQIDAKSTEEVKPRPRDIEIVRDVLDKNGLVIHQAVQMIQGLPAGYALAADAVRKAKPQLRYVDRTGTHLIFWVQGPVMPPENIAAPMHEYASIYLVYDRRRMRVARVVVLKEGWVEE